MAFGGDTSLGATGSTANNQGNLDLTTAAAINVGDFVVVVVAADNIANGGDDNACSGVTLGIGGQALRKAVQIANALAAQAGASVSIWYGKATSALSSGGIIRATFGSGTLVDASGLTARKFTIASGYGVEISGTPGTLVNNTGADPASLDVTTGNLEHLRVRGIASQVGNNTNLTPTASWTAWANGNSATTGTTGEICARAEHRIFTGTGAASDPTYVSAIYASAYVAFVEAIVGTLAAQELGDTAASSGLVGLIGGLAAQDGPDTAAFTGTVAAPGVWLLDGGIWDDDPGIWVDSEFWEDGSVPSINGTFAIVEGADVAAFTGNVPSLGPVNTVAPVVTGTATVGQTLSCSTGTWTGTPTITYAYQWYRAHLDGSGNVITDGEGNPVGDPITEGGGGGVAYLVDNVGARLTDELGNDLVTSGGAATSSTYTLTEADAGERIFCIVTATNAGGSTDAYSNVTAAVTGGTVTGALAAVEGSDTASFTGILGVTGTLSAQELGDTAAFTAAVRWIANLAAVEGSDTASFAGLVGLTGTLAAQEASDTAAFTAAVRWIANLAATEASDTAAFTGLVGLTGTLGAQEAGDSALFVQGDIVITGTLSAVEGADSAAFTGGIYATGTLSAIEAADTAAFAGAVRWIATLAATEAADVAAFTGLVARTGNLVAQEAGDVGAFTGAVRWIATLSAVEGSDTASFVSTAGRTGNLAAIEGSDTAAFTGGPVNFATLTAIEAADGATFNATLHWTGTLVAQEAADSAAFAGSVRFIATLSAIEGSDVAAFTASVLTVGQGTLAAIEAPDIARLFGEAEYGGAGTVREVTGICAHVASITAQCGGSPELVGRP